MSRADVARIEDKALRCYVCDNVIHILKRARTLAKRKGEDVYYTDKALQIRHKVNLKVVEVTGSLDRQRVFRHSHCNPNTKLIRLGDLI